MQITQTIVIALNKFIKRWKSRELLKLKGSMTHEYDYKTLRTHCRPGPYTR